MKTIRLIITIALIVFVTFGWLSFGSALLKSSASRSSFVKEGAIFYSEGLYQKSVESYKKAQAEKYKTDTEEALIQSMKAAYFDGTGEASYYTAALLELCKQKPKEIKYWKELLSFCLEEEDYNTGVSVCEIMHKMNIKDATLFELTDKFDFYFSEKNKIYNTLSGGTTGYYSAFDGKRWRVVTPDNDTMYDDVGSYIGGISSNNDFIVVYEKDVRLIDKNGVVQAFLTEHTDNMRAYGCGLIPMQQEKGTWNYYDVQGKKYSLTGYKNASSFQNDLAAVETDSGWTVIRTNGEPVKDVVFSDVKIYDNGEFMRNGLFVAAVDGKYNVFNKDLVATTSIDAKDMDRIYDSLIAFCNADNLWGYMDIDGNVVIDPQYEGAISFSNGLAGVCDGAKWAFVNEAGRIVSEYRFMYIGYNSPDNYCPVGEMNNEYYLVHFDFK